MHTYIPLHRLTRFMSKTGECGQQKHIQHAPSTKTERDYSYGSLKKNNHLRKYFTKNGEPQIYSWVHRRRRMDAELSIIIISIFTIIKASLAILLLQIQGISCSITIIISVIIITILQSLKTSSSHVLLFPFIHIKHLSPFIDYLFTFLHTIFIILLPLSNN